MSLKRLYNLNITFIPDESISLSGWNEWQVKLEDFLNEEQEITVKTGDSTTNGLRRHYNQSK